MMGRQAVSESLFYDFRIEDHVPAKHLLRSLDQVLSFHSIRATLSIILSTRNMRSSSAWKQPRRVHRRKSLPHAPCWSAPNNNTD